MNQQLRDKIPPIYHPFFEPVLALEFPEETIATCENCTRCRSAQSPFIDTKCCDYHPFLANYMVGGVFADKSPDFSTGIKRLREKISKRLGVTPFGIIPPTEYALKRRSLYQREEHFHKAAREEVSSLLCPYYDNGRCSIWKYRENLCVTYFCHSVGGKKGDLFWSKVNDYITLAERELSKYAMRRLGWPPESILVESMWTKQLQPVKDSGEIDEIRYEKQWRHWLGKEEEFYMACHDIVHKLNREDFILITGQDREILEQALVNTQTAFQDSVIPDYLILHPEVKVINGDKNALTIVLGESEVTIPHLFLPLIQAFNGKRHTKEVFDLAFQILLYPGPIIQQLRDKNMLIPVDPETKNNNS